MAKHTTGPLIVCTVSNDPSILSIEQDRAALHNEEPSVVAEVFLSGEGVDAEIGMANANLYAAAPDLLAACEAVVKHYESINKSPPIPDKYWIPGALMARAALAKARGESK